VEQGLAYIPARGAAMTSMAVRIRIAGYQDEQSVHTRAVRVMMRALREKAPGLINVDFESNIAERGRKVADLLDLVKSGDLDGSLPGRL
jgi:hypothetical protein